MKYKKRKMVAAFPAAGCAIMDAVIAMHVIQRLMPLLATMKSGFRPTLSIVNKEKEDAMIFQLKIPAAKTAPCRDGK